MNGLNAYSFWIGLGLDQKDVYSQAESWASNFSKQISKYNLELYVIEPGRTKDMSSMSYRLDTKNSPVEEVSSWAVKKRGSDVYIKKALVR